MKNCVIALGYFDSIHLGHREIINIGKFIAKQNSVEFILITFEDGFLQNIGRKENEVFLLEERKKILKTLEVNNVISLPNEKSFLEKNKYEFLQFISTFNPSAIIVGKDYSFGKNAEGRSADIKNFFENKGVTVKICELIEYDGKKISTSNIRSLLTTGNIAKANKILSNPFFYSGKVINGREKGKEIGIPTLNILIPKHKIIVKSGVYSSKVKIDNNSYLSVTNIGVHPTFSDYNFNIETHLLDFSGNLYGQNVQVELYHYIRDTIKFNNENDLYKQIQKDIIFTRNNL